MMAMMKLLFAFGLALLPTAHACCCFGISTPETALVESELIIKGKIIDKLPPIDPTSLFESQCFVVRVQKPFKGCAFDKGESLSSSRQVPTMLLVALICPSRTIGSFAGTNRNVMDNPLELGRFISGTVYVSSCSFTRDWTDMTGPDDRVLSTYKMEQNQC